MATPGLGRRSPLTRREVENFPVPDAVDRSTQKALSQLLRRLMKEYQRNSHLRTVNYRNGGTVTSQYFNLRPSKPTLDEIDGLIAPYYSLTDEELGYVRDYDLKYRMGRGDDAEADDDDEAPDE